jgi:hypothetical protein
LCAVETSDYYITICRNHELLDLHALKQWQPKSVVVKSLPYTSSADVRQCCWSKPVAMVCCSCYKFSFREMLLVLAFLLTLSINNLSLSVKVCKCASSQTAWHEMCKHNTLRNVGNYLPVNTAGLAWRLESPSASLWELQIYSPYNLVDMQKLVWDSHSHVFICHYLEGTEMPINVTNSSIKSQDIQNSRRDRDTIQNRRS